MFSWKKSETHTIYTWKKNLKSWGMSYEILPYINILFSGHKHDVHNIILLSKLIFQKTKNAYGQNKESLFSMFFFCWKMASRKCSQGNRWGWQSSSVSYRRWLLWLLMHGGSVVLVVAVGWIAVIAVIGHRSCHRHCWVQSCIAIIGCGGYCCHHVVWWREWWLALCWWSYHCLHCCIVVVRVGCVVCKHLTLCVITVVVGVG